MKFENRIHSCLFLEKFKKLLYCFAAGEELEIVQATKPYSKLGGGGFL